MKVIGVPWHIGHQFELAKLFKEYHLLVNPWRDWGVRGRPIPDNVKFVTDYKKGEYDFAILHVDQQSIYMPSEGEKISKGRLYSEVNELIQDIPKVVINHMTPFHDKYTPPEVVERIKDMVGDNPMIVNSYMAQKQWGWGTPIIHGMDASEWWDNPKEPVCFTTLSPAGMEKAYRRIFLRTVKRYLKDAGIKHIWVGVDTKFNNFDDYRDFISRGLVYFNPTWQSPRPRARTEAMLSGACVVTTPYHDANEFIKDGENGFLTSESVITDPRVMDNPRYTADLIADLILNRPKEAIEIGKRGKATAMELFSPEKFEQQWTDFLKGVL